jgi:hypothetical protein
MEARKRQVTAAKRKAAPTKGNTPWRWGPAEWSDEPEPFANRAGGLCRVSEERLDSEASILIAIPPRLFH